ncbi:MFS transporter [Plantactinospora sp. ZYX-F-223]|uniref:MFS transporter n=1 Tax=Plantactinospora sp. ZYX-F-223 TaxID=3144103 RepID=UPI0031FC509C
MTEQQLHLVPPPAAPRSRSRISTAFATRFGGMSRPFWVIFSGTIANRMGDMVVPFLVFYLGSRGISAEATGSIVVALGLGGPIGSVLGGWLADRVGRRFVLLTGLIATPASLGALFAAPNLPTLAFAAALVGMCNRLYPPAAAALIADSVTPTQRARAFSLLHWAVNIGTAASAATAGFLAARGYWLLFVLDAATCLIYAMFVARGIPKKAPDQRTRTNGGGYRVVLQDRVMMAFVAMTALAAIVYSMTQFAIPLAIRLDGLPPTVFGLVGIVNTVLVIALQPVLYGMITRFDRVRVLATSWALVAVGVASTGLAHEPWQYALTVVIWTIGEIGNGVVAGGIVADLAPAAMRGRYQGMISWAKTMAGLVGPALSTTLLSVVGPEAIWLTCLVAGLSGAVAVLALIPALVARATTVP